MLGRATLEVFPGFLSAPSPIRLISKRVTGYIIVILLLHKCYVSSSTRLKMLRLMLNLIQQMRLMPPSLSTN